MIEMMPRHYMAYVGDHIGGSGMECSFPMPQKHLPDSKGRTYCTLWKPTESLTNLWGGILILFFSKLDKLMSPGQDLL